MGSRGALSNQTDGAGVVRQAVEDVLEVVRLRSCLLKSVMSGMAGWKDCKAHVVFGSLRKQSVRAWVSSHRVDRWGSRPAALTTLGAPRSRSMRCASPTNVEDSCFHRAAVYSIVKLCTFGVLWQRAPMPD